MTESVIDFPKDSLCPLIWEKVVDSSGINEVWQLKPDVRAVLQDIFEKIVETTKQHFNIIHITGSITSNSYTENADIDMHFLSDQYDADEARVEQINTLIRDAFKYVKEYTPALATIGSHPIEVYYQPNKFQDMMSVGCYDFFSQKWLVGPEFTDPSFNPYSEYYQEIQTKSEGLAQQIRNMIFSIYEIAVVMKKNIATEFGNNIRAVLVAKLEAVQQMYDNIRQMRKVYSSPASEEQALEYRSSRKWKVADGAFKLFDKYGYMAILKQFIEDYKLIQNSHEVDIEIVEDILGTVKNYINNADKLAEKELYEGIYEDITDNREYAYHVSNIPPEVIKKNGFKAGLGNGGTDTNLFVDLYKLDYPKNYLFVSKKPWDEDRNEKFKYCYKIDVTDLDFYPDFGMLVDNGAYYEETGDDYLFYWRDKDIKFMKNKTLKAFLEEQNGEMTVNEMIGGETVNGEYFPDALYAALGSTVIDGDKVNKEHRLVNIQTRFNESELLDEGPIQNVVLATMLAIPGILPAKTILKSMDTQPTYSYIVNDINAKCKIYGQYTAFQAANIIARTLFAEARNDGEKGMRAVASVIYTRAEGKADDFANVCKKHAYSKKAGRDIYQFSCWNKMSDTEWLPKNFIVKIPKAVKIGSKELKIWETAMQITSEMLAGSFVPTVKANMYYNDKTANPDWGDKLTGVKYIGSHKFGNLKNHSAFV